MKRATGGKDEIQRKQLGNKMTDWYDEKIEEPLRDIVKLLRNNGFNTECSCGHEMYVQCQFILDYEFNRLHKLLYNYLHEKGEKIDFEIEMRHTVSDGHSYSYFDVKFPSLRTTKEWMEKQREDFVKMSKYYSRRIKEVDERLKKCKGKKKVKKLKNI